MSENKEVLDQPLDAQDWEIAFAPYKGNSGAALTLAYHLMALRGHLTVEPKIREAIGAIDRAVEVLYPHTQFHEVSYDLFLKVVQGKLAIDEEQKLRTMGIHF